MSMRWRGAVGVSAAAAGGGWSGRVDNVGWLRGRSSFLAHDECFVLVTDLTLNTFTCAVSQHQRRTDRFDDHCWEVGYGVLVEFDGGTEEVAEESERWAHRRIQTGVISK